jgi:hypothetical protein
MKSTPTLLSVPRPTQSASHYHMARAFALCAHSLPRFYSKVKLFLHLHRSQSHQNDSQSCPVFGGRRVPGRRDSCFPWLVSLIGWRGPQQVGVPLASTTTYWCHGSRDWSQPELRPLARRSPGRMTSAGLQSGPSDQLSLQNVTLLRQSKQKPCTRIDVHRMKRGAQSPDVAGNATASPANIWR